MHCIKRISGSCYYFNALGKWNHTKPASVYVGPSLKRQMFCVSLCLIKTYLILLLSLLLSLCQWMASGSRGLCGRAVLKPVEGGASRETGFVMGPFLGGSLALGNERRSDAAMKRDAQVSAWRQIVFSAKLHQGQKTVLRRNDFVPYFNKYLHATSLWNSFMVFCE